ncbi:MAG: hypothetical protein EXR54_06855 [Dehalococcoidia bacterium]|nr:hypothetical protein [Dehalococcoidia bacterium]MSQ17270.1 hypothetical protein [Dehalococcoidia bacterium]
MSTAANAVLNPPGLFDVTALFPADKRTYRYPGSLTAPPCSEGVRWHLFKTPVEISAVQAQAFKGIVGFNSRYVQKGVGESIKAVEDGSKEVAAGSALADEAGKALEAIMASVEAVTQQLEQNSAAAEEVSAAGDEMVKTNDGVSTIVEQNSAAAEEMAANSSEVNKVVDRVAEVALQNQASTQQVSASADGMNA